MANFYTLLTNAGISAIINARVTGTPIALTHMAVGGAEIVPSQDMTILEDEQYRFQINSVIQDEINPNHLIVEGVIPSTEGGFYVNGLGVYLEDGTLFAVGVMPRTYKPLLEEGAGKDLVIKLILEVSNSENIILKVDDSVVLATRQWCLSTFVTMPDLIKQLLLKADINGNANELFNAKDATQGKEVVNFSQVVGLGQNYKSRSLTPNVEIINTSGKAICFIVSVLCTLSDHLIFTINGLDMIQNGSNNAGEYISGFAIVPNNQTFKYKTINGSITVSNVYEIS